MAKLEDITVGSHLTGIAGNEPVNVVAVQWYGTNVIEITYKNSKGVPGTQLLYRADEESIQVKDSHLPWSFDADGDQVRLASEAYRIGLAHLFDPYLAVHTSSVEPLPHQISAVYQDMLPRLPLRFVLADDPGAGKTIMTGLFIKEMIARGSLKRCLIVSPGSLVEQWQDELFQKFHLHFDILTNDRIESAATGNVFNEVDLCICRLDKLARNDAIQEKLKISEWDLIVCDEAHKMSATIWGGEIKYTRRFSLGRLLSNITKNFLLLTATPHNGKEDDFHLFLSLIDPDRFEGTHGKDCMPQFMKSKAIPILYGGIESYLLALYGLSIPTACRSKHQETKYAPIIGLLGASVELVIKACLVQAKGIQAMYKEGDIQSDVYKFGTEVLKEFKAGISKGSPEFDFIWKDKNTNAEQKANLLSYVNKFTILQTLRANGLHAGQGCSRDITVTTANDIYQFFSLLSQGKKLKAYLKNIPAPESTVRDREVIIEDLSRRIAVSKSDEDKVGYLRNMYLIMPYIPDDKPEWVALLEKLTIIPPTKNDVSYLVETLENAHSIYLLKNRGGKEGLPVRIAPNDPNALPIDIQNIKRTLTGIPAEFNQDVLSANTRFEQNRLDLPIDDFLLDLFALGVNKAGILQNAQFFTAQQIWPFVVSAFSTQGTPRPCMELIKYCNEYDKLISYLKRANKIGNGYFKRRCSSVIKCVEALRDNTIPDLHKEKDKAFVDSYDYIAREDNTRKTFTSAYFRKYPISDELAPIIASYMSEELTAGSAIEQALKMKVLINNDRKAIRQLMQGCFVYSNRNGLVAVLRSDLMTGMHSVARKQMFALDLCHYLSLKPL